MPIPSTFSDAKVSMKSNNYAAYAGSQLRKVPRANLTVDAPRSVALVEGLVALRVGTGAKCLLCASGLVENPL